MMLKQEVIKKIKESFIVPVIRAKSVEEAFEVVEALKKGGIKIFEITMTVPSAVEIISKLSATSSVDIVVGAGTVLDNKTAEECLEAGAKFIVSPIFNESLIKFCNEREVLVMSGALTPTEVYQAWRGGSEIVKVFPASAIGGASYIKALKAPFPQIEIMATGGVSLENVKDFVKSGVVALGIGGELVKGEVTEITENARKYLKLIKEAES